MKRRVILPSIAIHAQTPDGDDCDGEDDDDDVVFCLPIHANVSKQFTFETHKSNESEQTEIKGVNRRHRDCSANVMNKTDVNQNSNNRSFLNLSKFHNSLLCLPFMATLPLATKFE